MLPAVCELAVLRTVPPNTSICRNEVYGGRGEVEKMSWVIGLRGRTWKCMKRLGGIEECFALGIERKMDMWIKQVVTVSVVCSGQERWHTKLI